MSELDQKIDDLASQYDKEPASEAKKAEAPAGEEVSEPKPAEKSEESTDDPPGYMNYEAWVAAGKDPDDFKGKNAYEKNFKSIKENKSLRADIREMKSTLKTTAEAINVQVQEARHTERAKVVAEFEAAKENDDIDAVIAAKDKLHRIDSQPAHKAAPPLNPVVSEFLTDNGVLNKDSDEFDVKARRQFEKAYDNKLRILDDGSHLFEEDDIKDCLNAAFKDIKGLNSHLFESPRNERKGPASKARRTPTNAAPTGVDKIERSNPRDQNAAAEVFELIKSRDPKAAEAFAKVMGEPQ